MNIGVFTDTYEPQINGVVTSIQTSVEYLRSQGHVVYIFCPNVTPSLASTNDVWRFHHLLILFNVSIAWYFLLIND